MTWQVPNPEHFGNPVNEPVNFGNPVTWQPTPSHFGNVITPATTLLATPVATPTGGSYTGAQSVTLTTDPNATATYYTTDGSTPTTGSTLYTGAITTTGSGTEVIKAFSHGTGSYSDSAVLTATYVITPAVVPPALIAHATGISTGFGTSPISNSINTTGANFLVAFITNYSNNPAIAVVSDTIGGNPSGNVWTPLSSTVNAQSGRLSYCANANVGANHVFTSGVGVTGTIEVAAFSGVSATPLEAGTDLATIASGASPIAGQTETPANVNDLIIQGFAGQSGTLLTPITIDTGFTITDQNSNENTVFGNAGALAYLVAPAATPTTPNWSLATAGSSSNGSVNAAVFAHA